MAHRAIDVLRPAFKDPLGLRDLVIVGADGSDWGHLLDWLARREWPTTYRIDEDEGPVPATFDEAFLARAGGDHTALLSVDLLGATVNCHFWSDWEIELDIASREFQTDPRLEALVEFARAAASAVGRPINLTEDNDRECVFAIVRSDGEVQPGPPSWGSDMSR